MKRELIEDIEQAETAKGEVCFHTSNGDKWLDPQQVQELCRLALRATDPEYVLVPREKLDECLLEAQQVKGQAFATLQSVKSLLAAAQEDQQ